MPSAVVRRVLSVVAEQPRSRRLAHRAVRVLHQPAPIWLGINSFSRNHAGHRAASPDGKRVNHALPGSLGNVCASHASRAISLEEKCLQFKLPAQLATLDGECRAEL